MRTVWGAILGALVGGAYEAFHSFELLRTGAYSLGMGIGVVLAGAAVGAVVLAVAVAACRALVARGK